MAPSRRRNTLSLAASMPLSTTLPGPPIVHEGWVLKKRRKKMQGFARRYFTLYNTGILSYAFDKGQPVRDQLSLHDAAVSTTPGMLDIHIDSSMATFHLKCVNTEDFDAWMLAFRKFIGAANEARRSASMRLATRRGSIKLSKSSAVIEQMGQTISELDVALDSLTKETSRFSAKSKSEKDKSMFGLFKKESSAARPAAESDPTYQIREAINALKEQHNSLLKSLYSLATLDLGQTLATSPQAIAEEDEPQAESRRSTHESAKRGSISSLLSDLSEWFDASDMMNEGAEEFIVEEPSQADGGEQLAQVEQEDTQVAVVDEGDTASIDTDIGELEAQQNEINKVNKTVVRRTVLPTTVTGDEGSLFSILKKNVGKDLSTITFPVTFNEPLTLLQRAAEELEYYQLLDQAAATTDPIERLCFIAALAVSSYAHTRHRSGRKGFNPMLAETFEDTRMMFISEKVRHVPFEMAFHAEGEGWEMYGSSSGKTKFWGKSLEIIPLGTTHVKIGDDHYQWKKPSSFMRNLMVGTKYLEHCGQMTIEKVGSSSRCVLDFKQSGYFAVSNVVSGTVHDESGKSVAHLEGKWDDQFAQTVDSSHLRVLWRVTPWHKNTEDYYGFTSWGITLNEIPPDLRKALPPTDSRFRPDVRALEEGDIDSAEKEKNRVEEMQRQRRRKGQDRQPRWFKQVNDEWVYSGGYWEARAKGWKGEKIKPLW